MKIGEQVEFEGYLIERGAGGFWVIDWDYESEETVALCRTLDDARSWILEMIGGAT